jgi:hypothetical protein
MTMAATQDRACSTSSMNKRDEAFKRLATSAIGTFQACRLSLKMSAIRGGAEVIGVRKVADTAQFRAEHAPAFGGARDHLAVCHYEDVEDRMCFRPVGSGTLAQAPPPNLAVRTADWPQGNTLALSPDGRKKFRLEDFLPLFCSRIDNTSACASKSLAS